MRFLFSSLHYLHIGLVWVTLQSFSHGRIPLLRTLLALRYHYCFCVHFLNFYHGKYTWLNVLLILFSFLMKSKKDLELRKWAAEGLSFLTMEADVKVHSNISRIKKHLPFRGTKKDRKTWKTWTILTPKSNVVCYYFVLTVPVVRPVIENRSVKYRLRAVSLFLKNPWGKAQNMSPCERAWLCMRAGLWAWCSSVCGGWKTSEKRLQTRLCAHLLFVLPHGFSRKREIARSLKAITFLLSEHKCYLCRRSNETISKPILPRDAADNKVRGWNPSVRITLKCP